MTPPPFSALRAFEAAARLRSFSAAGRELNVTHAAIAQQVKRLEQWFETPLMRREGRGVSPTEDGALLAHGLRDGFDAIMEAVARLTDRTSSRPLRITATPSFAANWLIPRLGDFRAAHPGVDLVIDPSSHLVDLSTGAHDVAIRYGRGAWCGLESRPLMSAQMVIAASRELIGDREVADPEDLLDYPWLREAGSDEWRFWLALYGVAEARGTHVTELPGHLLIDGLRRGLGVGLTVRAWIEPDISAGRIVTLLDGKMDDGVGYHLVTRFGPQRPPVKSFIRWATQMAL